jgi:hypothetical protein
MQSGTDFETASSVTGQSRHTLWHYTHANNESIAPFPFWKISRCNAST